MSDLSDIINNLIEKKGRFQVILIVLLCLNSIQVGINHTITSFHIYVPDFSCAGHDTKGCLQINGTESECLSGYEFDEIDDKSVAVEWSLVCDRKLIGPLINTLYFVGVTIGSLICSTLCDLWGRKKLVLVCMYMQAIMSLGLSFSNSLILFMIFRILQGFFIQGLQTCSYTLMLEYCPARYRTLAAVFWELNWAIGLAILGGVSYFIRDWRTLTLVLLIPTVLSLVYFWIIPESISWLYAKNRYKDSLKIIKKIAKKNNDMDLLDECNKLQLTEKNNIVIVKANHNLNDGATTAMLNGQHERNDDNNEDKTSMLDLVRNFVLRKHLIVMICVWFSVTLSYYGILYFLPSLAGQRHVNFLVGAGIEAIAYILAYFALSKFGRRIPMTFYQYVNGVLLITMGILKVYASNEIAEWFLIVIALIAKGLAVSSFCGMFIYCSELFPTICRGVALGLCGFAARCGSLLAPQLMLLASYAPAYVTMGIMAVLLILSASATLLLPETLSTRLPNTIEEADELWDKRR